MSSCDWFSKWKIRIPSFDALAHHCAGLHGEMQYLNPQNLRKESAAKHPSRQMHVNGANEAL